MGAQTLVDLRGAYAGACTARRTVSNSAMKSSVGTPAAGFPAELGQILAAGREIFKRLRPPRCADHNEIARIVTIEPASVEPM